MEDLKVAKTFVSAIIGEEVSRLKFCPQEMTIKYKENSRTVIRMDFLARIMTSNGPKAVIIEMQKAQSSFDIKRFRRYIGKQYTSPDNIYKDKNNKEHARQIYCIFFLGDGLNIRKAPVITVTNTVKDRRTGEKLDVRSDFIDGLHHNSWIVQIPHLKQHRRDDLEKLLCVFDQSNITDSNHILNVKEEDFPKQYRHIIRRLKQAAESEDIEEQMIAEDEVITDFQSLERQIEKKDEIIEKQDNKLIEKDKTIEEKDKTIEEKDNKLIEKDKLIEELYKKINQQNKT
jgi:hypothetical protein